MPDAPIILENLPTAVIKNNSPLLKGLTWPKDMSYINHLHGPNWMFYLTALIRNHVISNRKTLFKFSGRDTNQVFPYMVELMKLFNPISMLSLYRECLEYYRDLIVSEILPFNEKWYLNLLRSYHSIEDWENQDWFWATALKSVIFLPQAGVEQIEQKFPTFNTLYSQESHSGCPEEYLPQRFPGTCLRVKNMFQACTYDMKASCPVVDSKGTWVAIFSPESPFPIAVKNIDHFFLSLYPRVKNASFAFSMALDILQYSWSHLDWDTNPFATKHYYKLTEIPDKALLALNQPISQPINLQQQNDLFVANASGNLQSTTGEPQPFYDIWLQIKLTVAASLVFDYSSDFELSLLVSDLQQLVLNPHLHKRGRAIDYIILDHLRRKIDLFNSVQLASHSNNNNNNNNTNSTPPAAPDEHKEQQ